MVNCRFLGNACIEIVSKRDHIIIDPVFLSAPLKGIEKVFLTHHHSDHVSQEKLMELSNKYKKEDKQLEIFGPSCEYEELDIDITFIQSNSRINLNDGFVEVFENKCWKAECCVAYLINIENKTILHTADSAEFSDELRAICTEIDLCFIACFESNFDDYLGFINTVTVNRVIPYHFNKKKSEIAKKFNEYLKEKDVNSIFLSIGEEFKM